MACVDWRYIEGEGTLGLYLYRGGTVLVLEVAAGLVLGVIALARLDITAYIVMALFSLAVFAIDGWLVWYALAGR
jgi:hypothetical protein